jgi:hypothetical protein
MQVTAYVKLPAAVGATETEPVVPIAFVSDPPMVLEELAEQDVAFVELHFNVTAWPRLIVVA